MLRLLAVFARLRCRVYGHLLGAFAGVLEPIDCRISLIAPMIRSALVRVASFLVRHGFLLRSQAQNAMDEGWFDILAPRRMACVSPPRKVPSKWPRGRQ